MNAKTTELKRLELINEIGLIFRTEKEALEQARSHANKILYAQIAKNDADFDAAYEAASKKAQDAWVVL